MCDKAHAGGLNGGKYYGDQPWMYSLLGMSRSDFIDIVIRELESGVTSEYSRCIAENIADDVAHDICDSADVEKWNDSDLRLGMGRILLRSVEGNS